MALSPEQLKHIADEAAKKAIAGMRAVRGERNRDEMAEDLAKTREAQAKAEQAAREASEGSSADEIREAVERAMKDGFAAIRAEQDASKRTYQVDPSEAERPENPAGRDATTFRSLIANRTRDPNVKALQKAHDDLFLYGRLVKPFAERHALSVDASELTHQFEEAARSLNLDTRALSAGGAAGSGTDYAFTQPSPELVQEVMQLGGLDTLFESRQIGAGRKSFTVLIEGGAPVVYTVAENTGDAGQTAPTASTPGTGQIEVSANKQMARVFASWEYFEDSLIDGLSWLRGRLEREFMRAREDAILNGDTVPGTLDSDIVAGSHLAAFDGLRKLAHFDISATATADQTGTTDASKVNALLKLAGKYAKPGEGVFIIPVSLHSDWLDDAALITLDKLGTQATLLTGQIGSLYGVPVVVTEVAREDLGLNGVHDGIDTDKRSVVWAHRPSFVLATKRSFTVKTEDLIDYDQLKVVASTRVGFSRRRALTEPTAVVGYGY